MRAPNVAFQPQKLRFPRFSRPHSFVHSEHQPKECAGSRKEKENTETSRAHQLKGSWCSGITPAQHARGAGFNSGLSMPMCACVCHSLPIPGLSPFGFAVRLAKVERRSQQEQLRVQRAWRPKLRFPRFSRPHSFVHSEHQPKECAGSRKEKETKETSRVPQLRGSWCSGITPREEPDQSFPRFSRPHTFVHSEHQPKECAGSRKEKENTETSRAHQLKGSWCSGITPAQHARGAGFNSGLSMPMCACVCHSLPIPGLSPFGFAVRLAKVERRSQQEQLRVQRAWRPHLLQRARTKGVRRQPAPAAGCLTSSSSYKSFASRAFPGRTRLSTASANQRSAPAAERKRKEKKPLGLLSSGAVGVVVSYPLSMQERPG